ncbi:MAG: NAD(P)/FAD-dependent oxidoreductase [bacterium]|jgi:2-polyprenyl-6-methoxyphenol hydroxylase-like FAD-dependent oxidoreductase
MTDLPKAYDADVIVVGAGPCGSFLTNLLGQMGLSCLLLEKRLDLASSSMAIGVMPPSLQRLHHLNLSESVIQAGCPVTHASIFSEKSLLGSLDLSGLPPPFNYVLSVPQSALVRILRDKLRAWPQVRLLLEQEAQSITQTPHGVLLETSNSAAGTTTTLSARFVIACDGSRSPVRTYVGIPCHGKMYATLFMMGDFPETTPWTGEARLFFTPTGSIESFPLPQEQRRWVIQAKPTLANATALVQRVEEVTGIALEANQAQWVTTFTPERRLCRNYFKGRVALCGDAAHVMSPIGGQGMNTGLADAWHLAAVLKRLCETGEPPERLLGRYEHCRRRAFRVAANRAACGMWLGTRKGLRSASLRSAFVRHILFGTSLRHHLAPYFAMLTIPDTNPL